MRDKASNWGVLILVSLCFLWSAAAAAQAPTGAIAGMVVDETGEPVVGATVTVSGSQLAQPLGTATNIEGRYTLSGLPAGGRYTVTVKASGYGKTTTTDIAVVAETTFDLRLTLKTAESSGGCGAPAVKGRETELAVALADDELRLLPLDRAYPSLLLFAPATSRSGPRGGFVSGSSSALEGITAIDGLNDTDPVLGLLESRLPPEFFCNVELLTGGFGADDANSTGTLLRAWTPSGTNEFHGTVFGYYGSENLTASPRDTAFANGMKYDSARYDGGFTLGGPIQKDRLWFFAGYNSGYSTERREESFFNYNWYRPTLSRTGGGDNDYWERWSSGLLKLTYRASENHMLSGTLLTNPYEANLYEGWADSLFGRFNRMSRRKEGGYLAGITWNAMWSPKLFQDVTIGARHARHDLLPKQEGAEGFGTPAIVSWDFYRGLAITPGFGYFVFDERDTWQATAKWTFVAPSHEIAWGLDWEKTWWSFHEDFTGGYMEYVYQSYGDIRDPSRYRYRDHYTIYRPGVEERGIYGAAFLQDKWSWTESFTLLAGLRYEANRIRTQEGEALTLPSLSPRLGFTWDVAHNGKSKLYAHYGKYFLRLPLNVAKNMDSKSKLIYSQPPFWRGGPSDPVAVLPGTKNQYDEEWLAGFEYEVAPELVLGARAVYRSLGRLLEDVASYNSNNGDISYALANPGDNAWGSAEQWSHSNMPFFAPYPKPKRIYRALELTARRPYLNRFFFNASYTLSRLTGNTSGLYDTTIGHLQPLETEEWDLPSAFALRNRGGILPEDRTHRLKLQGGYPFDMGIELGTVFTLQSGRPLNKIASWPYYAWGYGTEFVEPRGAGGRLPVTWTLDLHAGYSFHLPFGDLSCFADLFNATNNQKPTAAYEYYYYQRGTFGGGVVNPYWGRTTARQAPRSIRLGLRWTF